MARGWVHPWLGVCVVGAGMAGGMHGREGVCGRGYAWQVGAWQGACMAGGVDGKGCAWQGVCITGGMHGRGNVWQGACVQGACMAGQCVWWGWQEKWPLQWAVCILLECILVKLTFIHSLLYLDVLPRINRA